MKPLWIQLCARLDAMTLRERAMVFAAATAGIVFLAYTMVLQPLLARQTVLLAQIRQQQNQVNGIDGEIAQMAARFVVDPDAEARAHLHEVQRDIDHGSAALLNMQRGLVAPEKIASMLEHLLRGDGKLRLLSMKTLPVTGLSGAGLTATAGAGMAGSGGFPPGAGGPGPGMPPGAMPGQGQAGAGAGLAPPPGAAVGAGQPGMPAGAAGRPVPPRPRELLYRHGVEIALQGSYLDMVSYMEALQALPSQLFWGKARLDAGQYPNSRLTLTLYTLSLDAKWMKL